MTSVPAMNRVVFTANLRRHLPVPAVEVEAATVREALDAVFAQSPTLRSYLLDDQGAVRKHVVIFVAGQQIKDRKRQSDPLPSGAELYVMQALSGG